MHDSPSLSVEGRRRGSSHYPQDALAMRLTFQPLPNFLGFVDLKLGASIITLFGVLNKVAGIYGIIAMFQGSLSWTQISAYLYSVATLVIFIWGLRGISEESPSTTLTYAHFYTLDHFIATTYTAIFAVLWWFFTPHDGRREAHSKAQEAIIGHAAPAGLDPDQSKAAAEAVWMHERGFALAVLVLSWMIKIYFIVCLYSFTLHVRRGTLPATGKAANHPLTRLRSTSYGYNHVRVQSDATTVYDGPDSPSVDSPAAFPDGPSSIPAAASLPSNLGRLGPKLPPIDPNLNRTRSSSVVDRPNLIRSRTYDTKAADPNTPV